MFSERIHDFIMPGGGTLIAAAQIGYFMGINRFILYGVDHDFRFQTRQAGRGDSCTAYGEGNHFIEDYRSGQPWIPPLTDYIEESFVICDQFLRSRGGWLKNATRGGKLNILERVNFDAAGRDE